MSFYPHKIAAAQDPSLMFNHTCLRVKDPAASVAFYQKHFGMELFNKLDVPDMKFSLYFLAFPKKMATNAEGKPDVFSAPGILELTHNWGTENDADFKVSNGNDEPYRGFGHICFSYADIKAACEKLENESVPFKKRLTDGRMKDIAFALDPDGYWIELIQYNKGDDGEKMEVGSRFNHTMIRVKDPKASLEFYQNVLGMQLLRTSEHESAKFTLYFLGYELKKDENSHSHEGVLELTHNWGTENDKDFKYHNGNDKPQGYGHICVSCKEPAKLCAEIEEKYGDKIKWAPKFNQGKLKNIGFLKDPDGYSIEVVPYGLTV